MFNLLKNSYESDSSIIISAYSSLIDFMKNNGFSLISKHPLFLDSYYISYLSSKYKNSFFPWINSLIIGTISNILGAITSKYSSSFYVFKKD